MAWEILFTILGVDVTSFGNERSHYKLLMDYINFEMAKLLSSFCLVHLLSHFTLKIIACLFHVSNDLLMYLDFFPKRTLLLLDGSSDMFLSYEASTIETSYITSLSTINSIEVHICSCSG